MDDWKDDDSGVSPVFGLSASLDDQESLKAPKRYIDRRDWLAIEKGVLIPLETPLPEHCLDTDQGWLDPDGKLMPCQRLGHNNLALRIEKTRGITCVDTTYCKLHDNQWWAPDEAEATQAQLSAIFDWCQQHRREMPWWTKPDAKPGKLTVPSLWGKVKPGGD